MILKDENQINTLFAFDESEKAITNLETKDKLIWIEHQIRNKKGSIRHFMGNDDGDLVLTGLLLGEHTTKVSNKAILRTLALNGTIIFLDSEGYEESIDRKYVITEIEIPERGGEPWEFTLVLTEFNN